MKKLILMCVFLISGSAHAGLKLQAQANSYNDNQDIRPQIGVAYYQPIFIKNFALNTWAGMGEEVLPDKSEAKWYVAKASLDMIIKDFTIGLGYKIEDVSDRGETGHHGFVKVEYKVF